MNKTTKLSPFFWKSGFIFLVLIIWEIVAKLNIFSKFLFPSISGTISYSVTNYNRLLQASGYTLKLLLFGLIISCLFSLGVGILASMSKKIEGITDIIISVLNPIPSIAMLPFALLWFGLGENPIVFVTFMAAFCPFLINVRQGFSTINKKWLDVGRNYGLRNLELMRHIAIPASLPYLLAGFRTAWGSAWRTVVAAELVFGAVGCAGGLGWLIYANRFKLNPAGMLSALVCISIIGIITENILKFIERRTVEKWGMKR